MKKIRIKLAIFFISLMFISSILSFFVSSLFPGSIKKEIMLNQQAIAISILELGQKTDLSIDDITKMTSTFMFEVHKLENIDSLEISNEELNKIQNHEIVFLSGKTFPRAVTMLMLDDSYIKISLHPHNSIFKLVASRIGLTLLSYIIIGALLIALSGKMALKPILKLSSATKEVAKGNFDVQVENNSDDEVGQLTKNFNKMIRELKSIEYLRKDFINSVSHEFKTPIASIQGFAKLLQKGNLSKEEEQEYADIIVEETTRLSKLSSNILRLSSLENQEMLEKKTVFSLDEQIRKIILLLEHKWSNKNIDFDIELDEIQYHGDEELLQQVWINLLDNAIKFSNTNSSIIVRLYRTASAAKLEISDTGIGMSEETMLRIFERFYQGDKAHSYDGNGLGLSLVKRILDLCNGSIHVKSKLHEGSTFTVELPVA
ncbi:MAG: histidine kinase [Clostridia bacterium BRH_c25]|nr:MAG: histidine kinase [Clostridia bacterium BRH_c25]